MKNDLQYTASNANEKKEIIIYKLIDSQRIVSKSENLKLKS